MFWDVARAKGRVIVGLLAVPGKVTEEAAVLPAKKIDAAKKRAAAERFLGSGSYEVLENTRSLITDEDLKRLITDAKSTSALSVPVYGEDGVTVIGSYPIEII